MPRARACSHAPKAPGFFPLEGAMTTKYALERARGVLANFVTMMGWGALVVALLSVVAT